MNPLYALGAAPFSDAFLAVAAAALVALVAALGLRGGAGRAARSGVIAKGAAR